MGLAEAELVRQHAQLATARQLADALQAQLVAAAPPLVANPAPQEECEGDMEAAPTMAVPVHELTAVQNWLGTAFQHPELSAVAVHDVTGALGAIVRAPQAAAYLCGRSGCGAGRRPE